MRTSRWAAGWLCVLCLCTAPLSVFAQDEKDDQPAQQQEMVTINLPENTNLKALVDFVGARLKLNIVYDQQLNGRQVTLKTPNAVPADSLLKLLKSMLKINGMALVETDVEGMLRVTTAGNLNELGVVPRDADDPLPEGAVQSVVSRIYKLEHVSPERAEKVVGSFINASKGASLVKLDDYDMIIITDFASNFERIERMLRLADQPGRDVATRFVAIEHLNAAQVIEQVTSLLDAQAKVRGDEEKTNRYVLIADERTNQLIIAARPEVVDGIEQIIASLDVSLNLETEIYRLIVVTPEHLDEVARELIGQDKAARLYKSVPDEETGLLAVTTTPEIHKQVKKLITTMDKPVEEAQSPIRFYKLQNASALAVREALSGIGGESGLSAVSIEGVNALPPVGFEPADAPPKENGIKDGGGADAVGGALPDVRVLAYEPMNTVIVIAPPWLQPIYEKLIKRLDERLPQVQIEATVVALDTTDDFTLGVEFSRSDSADGGTLLNFSQFGLSTVDPVTGALSLTPGVGFNGALLSADVAEVVIQALQKDTRSSVLTRPSVLVNDNAEGELESKDTEPFESVNANNQVATTSFGGELESGTKITVKPSISDGDFLKLEYSIKVSSFVGDRIVTSTGGTLPPGRTENNIQSEVTIPDGHTIVVGGLTRVIDNETIQRVPLLGQIPIVEYAFSKRENTKREITIFVFLRPVILRDDKFADLKVLSGTAAGRAHLPSEFPTSLPVEIR